MAKIKGWKKIRESRDEIAWRNKYNIDGITRLVLRKNLDKKRWDIVLNISCGYKTIGSFGTRKEALDWARMYMKENPIM